MNEKEFEITGYIDVNELKEMGKRLSELEKWKDNMDAGYGFHGDLISELEKNSLPKAIYEGLIRDAGNKINKNIDEIAELKELVINNERDAIGYCDDLKEEIKKLKDLIQINTNGWNHNNKRLSELEMKLLGCADYDSEQLKQWEQISDLKVSMKEIIEIIKDYHPQMWERLNKVLKELSGEIETNQQVSAGRILEDSIPPQIGSKPDKPIRLTPEMHHTIINPKSTPNDDLKEEMFICPYCKMPNTYLKSAIVDIWKIENNKLIAEFIEDLDKLEIEDATNKADRTYEAIEAEDIYKLIEKWQQRIKD